MRVTVASCFRNSVGEPMARFFRQVSALATALKGDAVLDLLLVHGDSTDGTEQALQFCGESLRSAGDISSFKLVERSHGGPVYGSTEELARMQALSFVGNGVFENVGAYADYVFYVESDLIWRPEVVRSLMDTCRPTMDIVAPLVFAGEAFYDIWGFRTVEGVRFGPFAPYSEVLNDRMFAEVGSVGSCLMMRGVVARECRIIEDYCLVGFCKDARAKGYRIYVDGLQRVHHP